MYRLAGFLFLITAAYSQIVHRGQCDLSKFNIQQILNITGVLGDWYEVGRINNTIQKGDCPSLTITGGKNDIGEIFPAHMFNYEVVNNKLSVRTGPIKMNSAYSFTVNYTGPKITDDILLNYAILKTNYQGYAILYSCQDLPYERSVMAWKLSRTLTVSSESSINFDTVIKNNSDIANANWITPSHSQEACKVDNAAINLHISPIVLLISASLVSKKYIN